MARHYGTFATSIWNDPEFRKLTEAAQRVYMMLGTQAEVSSVGTLPITLRRWSQYAADSLSDRLSIALTELADRLFLVIDWDNEELLIRSFVKWDGGYTNPKRLPAIRSAALTIGSPLLAGVLAFELTKLGVDHEITASPIDCRSIGYPIGIPENGDSPRSVVTTYVTTSTTHTPHSETTLRSPHPTAQAPAGKPATRSTRIPDPFVLSDSMRSWAADETPGLDLERVTAKFVDYWRGKSGRDATKADWPATWRNWLRRDFEDHPPRNGNGRASPSGRIATSDQRVADGLDLARRLAEREAREEQQQRLEIEA